MAQALFEARGGTGRSAGRTGRARPSRGRRSDARARRRPVRRGAAGIDRSDVEWADVVVTMGCGDACPYIPGKRYVDWELPDPAKSLDEVRAVRDEIARRIDGLPV